MSTLLLLQSLLILFAIPSESKPKHKCSHNTVRQNINLRETHVNYKNHPYDNHIIEIEDANQRRLAATQPSPLRIRPYYDPKYISLEYGLTIDQINYIKSIISTVVRFYSETVSSIPVEGNLFLNRKCIDSYDTEFGKNCIKYLKPDQCGMVDIPSEHLAENLLYFYPDNTTAKKLPVGTGIPDTDLVIYVSYGPTASCGDTTLAWATPCFQDQYGRPIAGTVNICPYIFEEEQFWKQDVVVLLHEITHVVVMGPELWYGFRDTNGDIIPHSDIVSSEQKDGLIYITTPKVRQFAQEHFGCNTLIGFPLENTGSGGSAGSHWDEHYGMSAVMGSTIWGGLQYFTDLTFSLLEDSGWYYVNYKYSEPFYWGKNTGCDFFNYQCIDWTSSKSNWPQYFCESKYDNGCFYNYHAPANCEYYYHQGDLPWWQQYFTDSAHGGPEAADYCPFRDPATQVNFENACWDERGNHDNLFQLKYASEKYGTNSRCVDIEARNGLQEGRCFEHKCFGYDEVESQWEGVEIYIDEFERINCTREDQPNISMVNKYVNALNIHIKCPAIDAICGTTSKPFECFYGYWNDDDNKCLCCAGYTGESCEMEDRAIGDEIQLDDASKAPTLSPTEPVSDILCVEGFSNDELNDIYVYDGIWNFYPRYKSPNTSLYVFWNIFTHWWMIYDDYDMMYYWALCNVSEFTPDITACNGEWKVWSQRDQSTFRESQASTYYGLCHTTTTTGEPTTGEPTTTTVQPTTTTTTEKPTTANYSQQLLQPTTTANNFDNYRKRYSQLQLRPTTSTTIRPSQSSIQTTLPTTALPTPEPSTRPESITTTSVPVSSRISRVHDTIPDTTGNPTPFPIVVSISNEVNDRNNGASSAEIINTEAASAEVGIRETERELELSSSSVMDEEESTTEDIFNVFKTSEIGGSNSVKSSLTKWADMDWIKFFFEGYIGWIFVSVLSLIILLLVCGVASMANCKRGYWKRYGYMGVDVGGGDKDNVIEKDEDAQSDKDIESDGMDETDGEDTDEFGPDVQTITSDLL